MDWTIIAGSATILIGALGLQRLILNARSARLVETAVSKQRIDDLNARQIFLEKEDKQDHDMVRDHDIKIKGLADGSEQNREEHRRIEDKIDKVTQGVAKLLNGGK